MSDGNDQKKNKLRGERILVTRAPHQQASLSRNIREAGGEPVSFPAIRITEPPHLERFHRHLRHLDSYDFLLFTSQNGVRVFFEHMENLGLEFPRHLQTAAIGPRTGEALETFGEPPEIVPEEYRAEQLADEMKEALSTEASLLLARSSIARPVLREKLDRAGFQVDEIHPYTIGVNREQDPEVIHSLQEEGIDYLTFASSRTVKNTETLIEEYELDHLREAPAVCIGPITAGTAREAGYEVAAQPENYTIDHMVEALLRHAR